MTTNNKIDLSGDGGVLKEILKNGTGDETASTADKVSLNYTGRLLDGTVFDKSVQPFEFKLGKGQVIKAFDMGIATMKLGERCILTCAPDYAYGASGSPPSIPPNSTLIFEIELLGWKGEDISPNKDGSIERTILEQSDKKRSPVEGSLVKVHLTGKYEGNVFEDREVQFVYGEGSAEGIVEGVEIALEKMNVGETSKIIIRSEYAYGAKGNEAFKIPPDAKVEYIIKLLECSKGIEEWKLSDSERIKEAENYKEKGTNYYKNENYTLAIKLYNKCINILPSDNKDDKVKKLKIAAHSNIVLCYQKTNDHLEAKQSCNAALKLDPKNVKVIYRRGQCNLAIHEFNDALADFESIFELDPSNKAAFNQVEKCKQKVREQKIQEKKIYANMFTKFAAADKETEPKSEQDVLAKCGEWSEEDAKREADLAFERDNNIVMI